MKESYIVKDILSEKFLLFYREHSYAIAKLRDNMHNRQLSSLKKFIPLGTTNSEEACNLLDQFSNKCIDPSDLSILASHSISHWIYLERRMAAAGWLKKQFPSDASMIMAKEYFSRIIYKYADLSYHSQMIFSQDIAYTSKDYLMTYRCETYARDLQLYAMWSRICAKGGSFINTDKEAGAVCTHQLRECLNEFDKNNWNEDTGFSSVLGFFHEVNLNDECKLLRNEKLISVVPNYENKIFDFGPLGKATVPNFIPQSLHIKKLTYLVDGVDEYFKSTFKIDSLSWLKCLIIFSNYAFSGDKSNQLNNLTRKGYSIATLESVFDKTSLFPELRKEDFQAFINLAKLNKDKQKNLNILGRDWNFFLLQVSDDSILIDFTLITRFFYTTMNDALKYVDAIPGKKTVIRGFIFEEQTYNYIKKKRKNSVLQANLEIKKEGILLAEIDIPLVFEKFSIFLDCKSLLSEPSIDSGNYKAMQGRNETLRKLLNNRDMQAKKVATYYNQLSNYKTNSDFLGAHLICANREWIPPEDDFFWWDKGVPRISTIEEFNKKIFPHLQKKFDFKNSKNLFRII